MIDVYKNYPVGKKYTPTDCFFGDFAHWVCCYKILTLVLCWLYHELYFGKNNTTLAISKEMGLKPTLYR